MDYTGVRLKDTLTIQKLYTIHYYEFSKQYTFRGERHDFWEMVYVDRGEIHACAEEQDYLLKQGEILFHEPNEWHRLYADGETIIHETEKSRDHTERMLSAMGADISVNGTS